MEDPVVPLERNLYGHLLAGFLRERQFEKVLSEHGWEKVPNWECLFVNRDKGRFLSVYVDDTKTGRQETEHQSDLESSHERSWFGRTDIVPWPCPFGLYLTRMSNKSNYIVDDERNYVWIQEFCWSCGKIARNKNDISMVLWHGRSCQEMRGKILRTGE